METLAEKVQVGMTKAQVKTIMGNPQFVEGNGRRVAYFDGTAAFGVDFDAEDLVKDKTPVKRGSMLHYIFNILGWR